MKRKVEALTIVMLVALVAVPAALAQYSSSKPQYARLDPYGPYQPIYHDWFQEPGGQPAGEEEQPVAEENSAAVNGADALQVETSTEHPNFLQPRFNFTQRMDSNGDFGNVRGTSVFSGSVELFRRSAKTQLSMEYAGGATLIDNGQGANTQYHQLRLRESFQGRRWNLMLGSETSFMPEAPFSLVSTGGIFISGTFDIGGVSHSFNNAIVPIQSLITGRSDRFGNASVAQFQYALGPRSRMFVVGAYGLLRFEDPKLVDSNQQQFVTGYQRSLSPRNTLGLTYGLSRFNFSGGLDGINNHTVQATYARSLTNRMALELAGGPQISMFHDLVKGDQTKTFWSVNGTVLYRLSRTHLGVSYSRGLTAGSGVLAGSQTDLVRLTVNRQLSRQWAMTSSGAYAHNSGLQAFTLSPTRRTYDSEYATVSFHRRLSRDRGLSFGYSLSHQNFSTPDCTSVECQGGFLRHAFHIGFEWDPRPFKLD